MKFHRAMTDLQGNIADAKAPSPRLVLSRAGPTDGHRAAMRFVGVDLAWGERNGTGVCVLGESGVVASSRLRSLDELETWLRPHTEDGCVVAIDAPLIVRNVVGRRPCEAAISHCFGRHRAGTYPSNLRNVLFRDGGRAAALARRLDLEVDPWFPPGVPTRRAIEVYPHAALVALFGLAATLEYKAKHGRTLATRKEAFATYTSLVESLSAFNPALQLQARHAWRVLTEEIATAPTGAALDRAEDEVDAYLCAYVALYYWTHGIERCRVVGDTESGYIVTPVAEAQAECLDGLRAALTTRVPSITLS